MAAEGGHGEAKFRLYEQLSSRGDLNQARAWLGQKLTELDYGITFRDHITELYYGIRLRANITEV